MSENSDYVNRSERNKKSKLWSNLLPENAILSESQENYSVTESNSVRPPKLTIQEGFMVNRDNEPKTPRFYGNEPRQPLTERDIKVQKYLEKKA